MTDVLVFLTSITLILLAGIISISLAKRTKFPLPLWLFFIGLFLGNIFYVNRPVIQLTGTFLSAFSIIALIIVLFYSFSSIKFYNFDKSMKEGFRFFAVSLILNAVVLSYLARLYFNLPWFAAIIFSLLISCVEYYAVFSKNHVPQHRILHALKSESFISSSFILLIPFLIISFMQMPGLSLPGSFFTKAFPVVVDVFAGIGAGIIVSLVLFRFISSRYFEKAVSFVVAAALLIAYIVAKNLGGNGLIAIATIGFVFGNVFLKHKEKIYSQSNIVYAILEIFMFILSGVVVGLPMSFAFYRISLGLFVVYLLIRFISANLSLKHYTFPEKSEIALFAPKGLATVTVAFALLNYTFSGVIILIQLMLIFFVYSLIFDTILDKINFYKYR